MLFESFSLKKMHAKNRIVMAPMCQYSADSDGIATDWHTIHYITRAIGQVGIIIIEAAAVEPRGRISINDLGIWNDIQIAPLSNIVSQCQKYGSIIGIQLAHAGRKAKIYHEPIVSTSSVPFSQDYPIPKELSQTEIKNIIKSFGKAAKRADQAGFNFIEIHGAHGYLINQFLSPLTNQRTDIYGTDRARFLKEILIEIKSIWPSDKPIFLRISAEEYVKNGNHPDNLCSLLAPIIDLVDLVHVSSGGVEPDAAVSSYPGYQIKFSEIIKHQLKIPTAAVGLITSPYMAEEILQNNRADLVALGRELLRNPYWPLHAARQLNYDIQWPIPYERAKL